MMKNLGKSTRIVLAVLIGIALLWVSFCMLHFTHAHIDENGHLLFHAHPFHENTGGHQLPHHTHTKIEYIFLSAFYHFVSLLLVCLFLWQWLSSKGFSERTGILRKHFGNNTQEHFKTRSSQFHFYLILFF